MNTVACYIVVFLMSRIIFQRGTSGVSDARRSSGCGGIFLLGNLGGNRGYNVHTFNCRIVKVSKRDKMLCYLTSIAT